MTSEQRIAHAAGAAFGRALPDVEVLKIARWLTTFMEEAGIKKAGPFLETALESFYKAMPTEHGKGGAH